MSDVNEEIYYSSRYNDDTYEYRHVILPKHMVAKLPKNLMSEMEWRNLGVQQSIGWEHYMIHVPERHILLFRRPLSFDAKAQKAAHEKLMMDMRRAEMNINMN